MQPLISERQRELTELCEGFGVRRLELFGSATGEQFNSESSDLDFLVDFDPAPHGLLADRYLGLLEALESLFGKPVDLVMVRAVKNPYFLQGIEPSRTLLYAA
jgi:predicted nucleotidyltransferase